MPPPLPNAGMPVNGGNLSGGGARKLIIALIIAVISLLVIAALAAGIWYWSAHLRQKAAAKPTPTPGITTTDAEAMLKDIDSAFDEFNASIVGLDNALDDQQGDLSE